MKFLVSLFLISSAYAATPDEGLRLLKEGNQRFVDDKMLHCDKTTERREAVTSKQMPFAAIVGCSDSRVSPEIVFDQGIGDLFVVRVAGNVVGPVELDSVEYAVLQLKSSLVLVLGHESCGAVTAVLQGKGAVIEAVAQRIQSALTGSPTLVEAIKANVRHGVETIKKSPSLAPLIKAGQLKVIGGYYYLNSGKVEILP